MAEESRSGDNNPYKVPEAALSNSDVHAPEGKMYSQAMLENLRDTKPWVRFIAVLGFIGIGFMFVFGISIAALGSSMEEATRYPFVSGGLISLIYFVLAGIYVIPTVFLNKYASSINELLLTGETRAMENALRFQKSFWKFVGIAAIICFVVAFIAIIVGVVFAIMTYTRF